MPKLAIQKEYFKEKVQELEQEMKKLKDEVQMTLNLMACPLAQISLKMEGIHAQRIIELLQTSIGKSEVSFLLLTYHGVKCDLLLARSI